MTKFINIFKKPCFWHIFGPFSQFLGQKKFFPENPALSCTTSYSTMPEFKKTTDTIPRKCPARQKKGRMDRRMDRPNFIGPFRQPPGVEKRQKHS